MYYTSTSCYRAQKRIWHGLWVFILLMYAPLVHTCLSLLHCPSIPPTQGGDAKPVSHTMHGHLCT